MAEKTTSLTFEDLGITKAQTTKDTVIGKVRSCTSLEKKEVAFLVISLLSILGVIGLSIEKLVTVNKSSADFTFALVLIMNCLFCLYYILSGVFFEGAYELSVFIVATCIVWLYLVLNYAISVKGPFKLARLIVGSVLSPCMIVLGALLIKSYSESKNLIFRTVGARVTLQDVCNTLFVYLGLLKGDLQVNLSLSVLILTSGRDLDLEDKIVLPIMLCIAAISAVLGYLSVRYENKILAIFYAVLWILIPAYAVYLIVKSVGALKDHKLSKAYTSIGVVSLIAAALALVVRSLILFYGVRVYLNFGKGLKEKATTLLESMDDCKTRWQLNTGEIALGQETCTTDADCASHTCHHGSPNCEIHDPNNEHGHCNCHSNKRQAETCTVDADCASHTCHHGSPHCEIHDPQNQHGHCNCHSAKRQAETCTVDADCASHTCHHGSPHCEIHDPQNQHGHCNCHSAKRQAETCTVDADCASHTCHHGSPHCEIHDPQNQHGHCNCHSAKRQAETCTVDADCASHTCHHGSPHCEIHDPQNQHGHCNCHSAKRAVRATHCNVDSDCTNWSCGHGLEFYCDTSAAEHGHWACDCRHHG